MLPTLSRIDKGQSLENSVAISMFVRNRFDSVIFWRTQNKNEVNFIIDEKAAFEIKFKRNNFNPKKYEVFTKEYTRIPFR